jgi:CRP-like cAMP-binding protein
MIKTLIAGRSDILPGLPENLSSPLFGDAICRHLTAGEALFHAGDPGDGCYRLEHGVLKVVITSPRGEERILAILGPGAIAGELSVIDGGPRSASVFAVKDCDLSFVSRAKFEEYAQQHPEIYRYLLDVLAARLRETDDAVAAVSFMTVKSRLARALLELAKVLGEEDVCGHVLIRHKIKQTDLAVMAGVARENVNRALSDWERRKVVIKSTGYYCLQDIATLKRSMDY